MMEKVKKELRNLLKKVGIGGEINLVVPPRAEMGDLSFNCSKVAKKMQKEPMVLARKLVTDLKQSEPHPLVEKIETQGAFVNFFLKCNELAKMLDKNSWDNYETSDNGQGKTIMIEYPSQNTHKEFHIGHLRNVCIGNTLVSLFRKSGYKVIPVNYLNDLGRHVVICLWGIRKFHFGEEPGEDKQRWLGQVYAEANQYIAEHAENEELAAELDELQEKLENKDPAVWQLFEKTKDWSVQGFERIQRELKVKHEDVFYESELKESGQRMVDDLLDKGIAEKGEKGAVVVDLSAYDLNTALIRKSSGGGVYITSDLALAKVKLDKYTIDRSVNITGSEQTFYFKQLYKILELYGFEADMVHIGHGLVNLPEGKMSSRAGNVILYEDLRDRVFARMKKETADRHADWSGDKIFENAKILTMAVLKFSMLKHESSKVISFDFEEAVGFEGFSAPYVLYALARLNSIMRKAENIDEDKIDFELFSQSEKKLLVTLGLYPGTVEKALSNLNPSVITNYCFNLARTFNDYYAKYSIISADDQELSRARVYLCAAVKQVLEEALSLLTMDTLEEM